MGGLTYFDFLAKFGVGGAHPGGFDLTKSILSSEKITKDTKILDAGCGTGQTAAYLSQTYNAKVTALEINPIMVEKASNRFQKLNVPVNLIQGSIEEIPLTDNTFDIILSESVLAFVNKPKALKEFFRVLKNGGRLIGNEMTVNRKLSKEEEEEIKTFYALDSVLLEEDWRSLLKSTGFKNIVISPETLKISQGNHNPEFNFSQNFEPELFFILNQHGNMVLKYEDTLSYRVFKSTK